MFRFLLALLALVTGASAADAPALPPPQDFLEYPAGSVTMLFLVALLMTVVVMPVSVIAWAILVFIVLFVLSLFGVTASQVIMKLAQRQMMGKGKGMVWQLAILICVPAGICGLWLATKFFGFPALTASLLVMGSTCGVLSAVLFVWLAKALSRRVQQRMMGGMQAQMMAEFMKMKDRP
jgi:hypothetical protein